MYSFLLSDVSDQNPSSQTGTAASSRLSQPCHGESSQCSDMSSYEEPLSPVSVASSGAQKLRTERGSDHGEDHSRELPLLTQHFMLNDPAKWNVEDVYEFICSLPGTITFNNAWRVSFSVFLSSLRDYKDRFQWFLKFQQTFANLLQKLCQLTQWA